MKEEGSASSENIGHISGKDWRSAFQRQLNVSIVVIASLLTVVGLLVLGLDLTVFHDEAKTVLLEVAVSLILFGITTLVVSWAVVASLETRMEVSITEILESEQDEIVRLRDTIKNLLDEEKREVVKLSQATQKAVQDLLDEEKREVIKLNQETQKAVKETQDDLAPLGGNWRKLGLTNVYLTRSDALADFGDHIRDELYCAKDADRVNEDRTSLDGRADPESGTAEPDRPRLWIAASSMKGLLESASTHFDGLGIFTWAAGLAAAGKLDLRIIMTHPDMARLRAGQEDRGRNAIPEEIQEAVNHLKRQKVPPKYVKMVVVTPTVFAIATRDRMLLNPYPYSQEAYRSFTLTVRRSQTMQADHPSIERDIFEQYKRRHFDRPWETALPLGEDYEIPKFPTDATPPPDANA